MAEELQWWKNNIMDSFAPWDSLPVNYIIYSDTSLEGWRGTDQEAPIEDRYVESEKEYHINTLELEGHHLNLPKDDFRVTDFEALNQVMASICTRFYQTTIIFIIF